MYNGVTEFPFKARHSHLLFYPTPKEKHLNVDSNYDQFLIIL